LGRAGQIPIEDPPSQLPEIIDEKKLSETNHSCIVALIIWPDANNTISHYLAGDANYKIERAVLAWSQHGQDRTAQAIKLSHHGAANSTPIELIQQYQPEKIIVSAGYEYGHPSTLTFTCIIFHMFNVR
jgi:beta-lactamase superfamily II metal-dependent hydrolase